MKVTKITHKKEERIKIEFSYNEQTICLLRQIEDSRWSHSHGAWHVPYTREAYSKLKELFPGLEKETPVQAAQSEPVTGEQDIAIPKSNEITATYYGKRILLFMKSNEEVIRFLQTIKGIFFDKERKCWSVPNHPDTVETIQHRLGSLLVFKNKPSQTPISKKQNLITDCGLLRIVKTSNSNLHLYLKYQKDHVDFLKELPYCQWNSGKGCWDCPDTEKHRKEIKS
ncbi:MAG: hypothetical protein H7329_01635, partial [Opitutaceae bacterium]|nr:hypothetical protein [Cytophagales bacterium]